MKKKAPRILNQILLKVAQYMLNQGTVPPMRVKVKLPILFVTFLVCCFLFCSIIG